ncbi:MAG: hypothetical protein FWG12_03345 [Holophagaceae bacterium]|jgi:mono/diheme cytochrome c family protein|nr:hypothetical protein [Holophagaceae bacterium]
MKKNASFFLGFALIAVAPPLVASAKMVKASKDAGVSEIKNCASCHDSKKPSSDNLNEVGKWLVAQKAIKKAADYDMAWLKEYFASKKQ